MLNRLILAQGLIASASLCQTPTYRLETLVGADMPPSIPALEWNFNRTIYAMAIDRDGVLWFLEGNDLRKLTRDGRLLIVPIKVSLGFGCDYSRPKLDPFYSLAIGPDGLPYIFDPWCQVVRRIRTDGTNEIFAGRLDRGAAGNGGPAKDATLGQVQSICFDATGNLFLLERDTATIRKIDTRGVITAIPAPINGIGLAQTGGSALWGIAVDLQGNIFVSERFPPHRILKLTPGGAGSVFATLPNFQFDLALDGAGNLYSRSGYELPVYRIAPDGKMLAIPNTRNVAGGMAVDSAGNVFFGDVPYSISVADPQGNVRRVAGTGKTAIQAGVAKYSLIPGSPSSNIEGVTIPNMEGMWIGSRSNLYHLNPSGKLTFMLRFGVASPVPDSTGSIYHIYNSSVWKLDSAQNGARAPVIPENGKYLTSLAVDSRDNVYAAYINGPFIQKLDVRTGALSVFAGNGTVGDSGDGGPATSAQFRSPWSVAFDRTGNLYVADLDAARVRKIDVSGNITTVAGVGVSADGGEGVLATNAPLVAPGSVAADPLGNLYIAEWGTTIRRIRMVDRRGIMRTIAGGPSNFSAQDGTPALEARLDGPANLNLAPDGTVYFVDSRQSVRKLVPLVTEFPRTSQAGAVHGATFLPGAVAPGMILTLFGTNIGGALARGTVSDGRFGVVAGATWALFDGVPARMLYSSAGQVGVVIPYALTPGKKTTVVVGVNDAQSTPIELDVVAARPGLFTADSSGRGPGAILNQNGTLNTTDNPEAAGKIVVLFGTGEGQTTPTGVDGQLASGATLPRPRLPAGVTICGEPAEVLYAGAAPGAIAGLLQVNARIPTGCAGMGDAEVRLRVGDSLSTAGVTVAVE